MTQEQEKHSLSPTEKLDKLFTKAEDAGKFRRIELSDGTIISLYRNAERFLSGNSKKETVRDYLVMVNNEERLGDQIFAFRIGRNSSLEFVSLRSALRIGNVDTQVDGPCRIEGKPINVSAKDKINMAIDLVDWLDKIVIENRYSNPPTKPIPSK